MDKHLTAFSTFLLAGLFVVLISLPNSGAINSANLASPRSPLPEIPAIPCCLNPQTGRCEQCPAGCNDTDNGRNYLVQGTTTYIDSAGRQTLGTDFCSDNTLTEYYCPSPLGNIASETKDCADLGTDSYCSSGRCINPHACTSEIVHDGDPFIGESASSPNWVWMLKNLDEDLATNVDSVVSPELGASDVEVSLAGQQGGASGSQTVSLSGTNYLISLINATDNDAYFTLKNLSTGQESEQLHLLENQGHVSFDGVKIYLLFADETYISFPVNGHFFRADFRLIKGGSVQINGGPVIGVANHFEALNLNENVLTEPSNNSNNALNQSSVDPQVSQMAIKASLEEEYHLSRNQSRQNKIKQILDRLPASGPASNSASRVTSSNSSWAFPRNYASLAFNGIYPDLSSSNTRPSLTVETKHETLDTSGVANVPQQYVGYLNSGASVISLNLHSEQRTAVGGDLPVIFLNYQLRHLGLYESVWANDSGDNTTSYYATLYDVNPDNSLYFKVYKQSYNQITHQYEYSSQLPFTVVPGQQYNFHGQIIYPYLSQDYGTNNDYGDYNPAVYNEWAIVYVRPAGETLSTIRPTAKLVIQPVKIEGAQKALVFYEDPLSGNLFYDQILDLASVDASFYIGSLDYYYSYSYLTLRLPDTSTLAVNYFFPLFWDFSSSGLYSDNLLSQFRLDSTGRVASLGYVANTAEDDEQESYYNDYPGLNNQSIGNKNTDSRTSYGAVVKSPATNSLVESEVFQLPPDKTSAFATLWANGAWGENAELGRKLFHDSLSRYYWPLKFDYQTMVGDGGWQNPLGLQNWTIIFDNQNVPTHEALLFGRNSPSVETSLTSGNDAYLDKVYVQTSRGDDLTTSDGMKYLYAFDSPVNLQDLSATNKLTAKFLGSYLTFVGYNGPNSLLLQKCGGEYFCDTGDCSNETAAPVESTAMTKVDQVPAPVSAPTKTKSLLPSPTKTSPSLKASSK